ncbi:MAG: hypothetical protein NC102_04735 [Clostridium sp.]|nr:hypothetical protein [Clostridium sp.]
MKTECTQLLQLLRLEMRDNGKKYLMWIGIIFITLAAVTAFATTQTYDQYTSEWRVGISDPMTSTMDILFWFGFVSASCVFASQVFSPLTTKGGVISFLMLPATQLNKYIVRWLLFVPAFILTFIICFELVDMGRAAALTTMLPTAERVHLTGFDFMPSDITDTSLAISLSLLLPSFYVLGSAIWPKRSFLYTTLWLGGLVTICSVAAAIYYTFLLSGEHIPDSLRHSHINQEAIIKTIIGLAIAGCLVNYVLAYFRFKETEIIQRW